ncbi:hypothetical protein niasHT_000250 [Heterodera trifolii]|uniref:LNS2/PITP domain-containing protein n=1 Tax=Heterodera trifolii TaxID=157864 RepID=A0ABD2LTB9_9BILA
MEQTTENATSKQITDLEMHEVEQGSRSLSDNQEAYTKNMDILDKMLAKGHKLILAQSFNDASVVLRKAAQFSSKYFGDFAPQSFLPHFNYGKALIEIARLESLPIKPPVDGIDETVVKDEEQSEELQSNGGTGKEQKEEDQQKTEEQMEKTEEKGGEEGTDESAEERDGEQNEAEKGDNGKEVVLEADDGEAEKDGDEDDGQIAWESLEVARKICENQMKSDHAKLWTERKSDVLVALGDCMTVSENFQLALKEFMSALEILKELFGEADRRTAEVYFWVGRTHKLIAAQHFESGKKVLMAVIAAKERELEEKGEETCESLSLEIEELKDTVKGVEEKVQDAFDLVVQRGKRDEAMKAMLQPLLMQSTSANGNTPLEVNDVTGMLKRKAVKRHARGVKVSRRRTPSPHAPGIQQLLYMRFVYLDGKINFKRCFMLVDLASHVSLLSPEFWDRQIPHDGASYDGELIRNITGVNGDENKTSGRVNNVTVEIGTFRGVFHFDVLGGKGRNGRDNHATLGLDFLLSYVLRVNCQKQTVTLHGNHKAHWLTEAEANHIIAQQISNLNVLVYVLPSGGEWFLKGVETTDKNGRLSIDLGRSLPIGIHNVRLIVQGDHTYLSVNIAVVPPGTPVVVFSIDGSLTASVSVTGRDPRLRPGAVDVVRFWQQQGFLIIYLTARPDMQQRLVSAWLATHNFPQGLLFFTPSLSTEPLRQKTQHIKHLLDMGICIHAAYGSAKDIPVYSNAGLDSERIFKVGGHRRRGCVSLDDGYCYHLHDLHSGKIGIPRPFGGGENPVGSPSARDQWHNPSEQQKFFAGGRHQSPIQRTLSFGPRMGRYTTKKISQISNISSAH